MVKSVVSTGGEGETLIDVEPVLDLGALDQFTGFKTFWGFSVLFLPDLLFVKLLNRFHFEEVLETQRAFEELMLLEFGLSFFVLLSN